MNTNKDHALLDAYSEWLDNERRLLHLERFGKNYRQTLAFVPATPAGDFHFPWGTQRRKVPPPSSHR